MLLPTAELGLATDSRRSWIYSKVCVAGLAFSILQVFVSPKLIVEVGLRIDSPPSPVINIAMSSDDSSSV